MARMRAIIISKWRVDVRVVHVLSSIGGSQLSSTQVQGAVWHVAAHSRMGSARSNCPPGICLMSCEKAVLR